MCKGFLQIHILGGREVSLVFIAACASACLESPSDLNPDKKAPTPTRTQMNELKSKLLKGGYVGNYYRGYEGG